MCYPNEEELERGGKGDARQVLTPEPSYHLIPSAYVHRGLSWFVCRVWEWKKKVLWTKKPISGRADLI